MRALNSLRVSASLQIASIWLRRNWMSRSAPLMASVASPIARTASGTVRSGEASSCTRADAATGRSRFSRASSLARSALNRSVSRSSFCAASVNLAMSSVFVSSKIVSSRLLRWGMKASACVLSARRSRSYHVGAAHPSPVCTASRDASRQIAVIEFVGGRTAIRAADCASLLKSCEEIQLFTRRPLHAPIRRRGEFGDVRKVFRELGNV